MRTAPEGKYDHEELARLNAEPWMVEQLALNPSYPHWGPHEDYMCKRGDGWESPLRRETWAEFDIHLDELNEVVNFYFEINRDGCECDECEGSGYNAATDRIADAFYSHGDPVKAWNDKITQDEVQALVNAGRLFDFTHTCNPGEGWVKRDPPVVPTADEVNAWQRGRGLGHDAINRGILVEARAKRLGVWGYCPKCEGHGHVFTEPAAKLGLVLWLLHPRKGASRGVEVRSIQREQLPEVYAFLRAAAARNAERFGKIPSAGKGE